MSMGLSYLPKAMSAVVSAASETATLRNEMSQQANERRGRELADTFQIMGSTLNVMTHSLTAKAGLVDFSV